MSEGMFRGAPAARPYQHAVRFNIDGADVDNGDSLLTSDITPKNPPSLLRVMVSFATACKFKMQLTQNSTTKDLTFNNDTNLAANALYMFDILVTSDDTINFEQDQDNQTINILVVQEIFFGAQ